MKKIGVILSAVFLVMMTCFGAATPVMAEDNCIETAILGENHEICDDGKGSAVTGILEDVVKILSVGVGILGVLGITIVGIQYLTAGGSEEKTRKAKRRMLEIIIGLVAYVLIYALLKWLKVA